MAINRYTTSFRERNDILDQITPNWVVQREVQTPAGDWKPASWLPVQFTKTNVSAGTDAFVISAGKVLAFDSENRLVPAGMKAQLKATSNALVYTATDVAYKVTNLVTGELVTAAVAYTNVQVAQALVERGLVLAQDVLDTAGGAVPPTTTTHANIVINLFISPPCGVAHYDFYKYSGRPEDGDQDFTNYSKQHAIQFLTEVQAQVPQLTAGSTASDAFATATLNSGGTATAAAGDQVLPGEYWNATNLAALTKYSVMGITASSPVVALGLDPSGGGDQFRVARNTDRTPFTCDDDTVLVKEKTSPELIKKAGDWYLDSELGVLFVHSTTWATAVAATDTWTFTYNYYSTTAATAHRHVHFDGPARPGVRVTFDSQSNFVMDDGSAAEEDIVGRVLRVDRQAQGLLKHVKTGFKGSTAATAQMPGSATKGYTDLITLSEETVADQVVIVNVRI